MSMTYFAPGKLMISGEYVVLNGATAFAVPVRFGQSLQVLPYTYSGHKWQSYEPSGLWFEAVFSKNLNRIEQTTDTQKALLLQKLLQYIRLQKPDLWHENLQFVTRLNFDRNWGLGSSSSLLVLLHQWSGVDPFQLLDISFGGSGYDIAVAIENKPIWYRLSRKKPENKDFYSYRNKFSVWKTTFFNPSFSDKIFFVYRNRKQNSRHEISKYRQTLPSAQFLSEIDTISRKLPAVTDLQDFEGLIKRHEQIISDILQRPALQTELFNDFSGVVKSLGAWGGDFFMAIGNSVPEYFHQKGFHTVLSFQQMIL